MPARNPEELPEGTDHVVNGALETNGTAGNAAAGGGGFVASGATTGTDDTGGTASGIRGQIHRGAQSLKSQASDKARTYAMDGKARASDKLDDLSRIVEDTARSIDERLGSEYGDYARKAATFVSDFSSSIRDKDVDELVDDARSFIRKSPAAAIGVAAVVGFTLVRLVKAGLEDSAASSKDGAGRKKAKGA
ncbi:MAG TPA: hypothetical protein VI381_00960 [Allosphingosinicella sp.]